jgi:hypothetical protein
MSAAGAPSIFDIKGGRQSMPGTDKPEELVFALRDALADIRPNAPPPSNGSE